MSALYSPECLLPMPTHLGSGLWIQNCVARSKGDKGSLSGKAGEEGQGKTSKINGPVCLIHLSRALSGIPFEWLVEKSGDGVSLMKRPQGTTSPSFLSVNFHEGCTSPTLPHPDFIHQSPSRASTRTSNRSER